MKKVLILDRPYAWQHMNSGQFELVCVCLQHEAIGRMRQMGLNVVACFADEYPELLAAEVPENYLIHSFDSDRFLEKYSYAKRVEILGKEISFWSRVLDEQKPDLILNEICTIEWMEVLFIEARKRGIPYMRHAIISPFIPEDRWIVDRPFVFRFTQEELSNACPTADDYAAAEKYVDKVLSNIKPFYVPKKYDNHFLMLLHAVSGWTKIHWRYFKLRLTEKFVYEEYRKFFDANLKQVFGLLWRKYDKFPEAGIKYVFYPIHYEPEATISYYGDCYDDQPMLIGRIAHALPTGWKLIVKEHPQQRGKLLSKTYRELKRKYSNIVYLPGEISSNDIYPKIEALITLNGTAGLECMIMGMPVVVFGEVFYKDLPGATACRDFKELKRIIREQDFSKPDLEGIKEGLARMHTFVKPLNPWVVKGKWDQASVQGIQKDIEVFLSKQ